MGCQMGENLSTVLKFFMERGGLTIGLLEEKTGISYETIKGWRNGRVKKIRNTDDVVKIAAAMRLTEKDTNLLFQAANQDFTLREVRGMDNFETTLKGMRIDTDWPMLIEDKSDEKIPEKSPPFINLNRAARFFGREQEKEKVKALLNVPGSVVVLHGPEGVGKSALAAEVAFELQSEFVDGVLAVQLDNIVANGELVPVAALSTISMLSSALKMGLPAEIDWQGRSQLVRDLIGRRRILLILDNAYGSLDLDYFLPGMGNTCSVLITTANQQIAIRDADQVELLPFEGQSAVQLLEQLLERKISQSDKALALEVVARLAGLPLTLTIAAKTMSGSFRMSLKRYARNLANEQQRLELNESQALCAPLNIIFGRLSEELQELLKTVAIFDGSILKGVNFSFETVADLVEVGEGKLFQLLGELANVRLLEMALQANDDDLENPRFQLHSNVRDFARSLLDSEPKRRVKILGQLLTYFTDLAKQDGAEKKLHEADLAHLISLLNWAYGQRNYNAYCNGVDALTTIKAGLFGILDARGHWQSGRQLLEQYLALPQVNDDPVLKAQLLLKLGGFALRQAQPTVSREYLDRCWKTLHGQMVDDTQRILLAYVCELKAQVTLPDEGPDVALSWSQKGIEFLNETMLVNEVESGYLAVRHATILGRSGQYPEAMRYCQQGLALLGDVPSPARISGHMTMGTLFMINDEPDKGIAEYRKGVSAAEVIGDYRRLAGLWQNIGISESWRDNFQQSISDNLRALELFRQLGDLEGECNVAANIGLDYTWLGEFAIAREYLVPAQIIARTNKLLLPEIFITINLARVQLNENEYGPAAKALLWAQQQLERLEDTRQLSEVHRLLAQLALRQKDFAAAEKQAGLAVSFAVTERDKGTASRILGDVHYELGQFEKAKSVYDESLALLADESEFESARTKLSVGKLLGLMGERAASQQILEDSSNVFKHLGIIHLQAEAASLLTQHTHISD